MFILLFLFAVLRVCVEGEISHWTRSSLFRLSWLTNQYWVYRHKCHAWFLVGDWELNEILIWANSLSCWAMSLDLCAMLRNRLNNSNWVGDIHTCAYTCMYTGGKISSSSMSKLRVTNVTFSEDIAKYEGHVFSPITTICESSNQFKRASPGPSNLLT